MAEKRISADSTENIDALFGPLDENVKMIERKFSVECVNRESEYGNSIIITGDSEEKTDGAACSDVECFRWIGAFGWEKRAARV